jgi:hypothetical protein
VVVWGGSTEPSAARGETLSNGTSPVRTERDPDMPFSPCNNKRSINHEER